MIEVEVRGQLTQEEFEHLKAFLTINGILVESHSREMIRLYDYPGFDEDSNKREVDIRLRNTNGDCEIMVKRKAAENNVARHELSLKLRDTDLDTAKAVIKALGYEKGLWMHRIKDIFSYHGIEWSLVQAPPSYFYFEAEREVSSVEEISQVEEILREEAKKLSLSVFSPEEYLDFISHLTHDVNKVVVW